MSGNRPSNRRRRSSSKKRKKSKALTRTKPTTTGSPPSESASWYRRISWKRLTVEAAAKAVFLKLFSVAVDWLWNITEAKALTDHLFRFERRERRREIHTSRTARRPHIALRAVLHFSTGP